jgi:hypothetical protein
MHGQLHTKAAVQPREAMLQIRNGDCTQQSPVFDTATARAGCIPPPASQDLKIRTRSRPFHAKRWRPLESAVWLSRQALIPGKVDELAVRWLAILIGGERNVL